MKLARSYYDFCKSTKRIQVHQGGTRSGKTYSILTGLVELCYANENAGIVVTIVRKTFPALRGTAYRDFFEILERENLYDENFHNKSEATYELFGNLVEFISVDQPQKVRGRKRDVLYVNEANEISLEDWRQLLLRTTGRAVIDYNPSDEYSWIYEEVIPREDADFFKTTYLDNPFLDEATIKEIERLKNADANFWRVYGLGERGASQARIFTHFQECAKLEGKLVAYGLDFGYTNDPSAIVKLATDGEALYVQELLYRQGMSNRELAEFIKEELAGSKALVIADSAEPKSIDEIHRFGINIHPAKKGTDSVRAGIQYLKSRPLFVTSDSVNLLKELRNYKYKEDKNGRILNEPVDSFNHGIDALRYAASHSLLRPNYGRYRIV